MSLKMLTVPLSFVILLVLVIFYIKPDIDALPEKKLALETKKTQSANMTTLLANIDALSTELDTRTESEHFVMNYLPEKLDEELVMDMFNFLAVQSGAFPYMITLKEIADVEAPAEAIDPITGLPVVSTKVKPKSFSAIVQVKGDYGNIKNFFDHVAHMNRFHKTRRFALLAEKPTASADNPDAANGPAILTGTFEADFDYFPVRKIDSALNVPTFNKGTLDTTGLDAVMTWVTSKVPTLEKVTTGGGRADPFR
jgi:Tfp pilus assembly protein PilO